MEAATRGAFLSSFVGRRAELHDVQELVHAHRLVTLLGVGGLGKTRLAYRAFAELEVDFVRAWSVDLADLVEAPLLVHTIGAAMDLPAPSDERDVSALVGLIGEDPALLLLDNCEHLVDACAALVTALLTSCPKLHVLTTSRQALGVPGEKVYAVPTLEAVDAVDLFGDRAASALAGWTLSTASRDAVRRLCDALDGIPLAIELAAVQIRAFTPADMAARLASRAVRLGGAVLGEPARRTSLEACIRWSYDLCSEDEQLLWSRLAVFGGGFSLDAVEDACVGDGLAEDDVVTALAGLVEKSLLHREPGDEETRYRMLEVIRQFGVARLGERGELDVWRRRHRDYYLGLAERFDREWIGPHQLEWMNRFRRDHANLRLAFDFSAVDPEEAPHAMRMCAVLEHYFASTGGGAEALHWLQLALAHGTGTPNQRASALRVGTFIAVLLAQLDTAASLHAEMERLVVETGDLEIRAFTLYAGAMLRTWQGDAETGAELAAACAELLHELGDVGKEANIHFLRGMMLGWADRSDEAAAAYQRCLDLTQPRQERWLTSYSQWGLGVDALMAGNVDEAIAREREALDAKATFGDQLGIGLTIEVLAWSAAEQKRGDDAAVLLGAAEAIWNVIGMSVAAMPYLSRRREAGIAATQTLLPAAEYAALVEKGRTMLQADAIALALGRGRPQPTTVAGLTRREEEIARRVASGASNKEIADELVISVRTVETHVEKILRKLSVDSRGKVAGALAAHE